MRIKAGIILAALFFCAASHGFGWIYEGEEKVVGRIKGHTVREGDSLIELARHFGLGFNELADANPRIDPFVPERGTKLVVPTSWIVPDVPPTAVIVVNLSELRLYYFFNSGSRRRLVTFPVGIGDEGNSTPVGFFRVREKREMPSWRVPASIRRERPELPAVVSPGEENPLGSHAIRLSDSSILIHGTNRPWGVGRRVSHGCIRLYPEDIPFLYDRVGIGDPVLIVRQPVKVGVREERIFIEVHDDREENDYIGIAKHQLAQRNLSEKVDFGKLFQAIREKRGYPVEITQEYL